MRLTTRMRGDGFWWSLVRSPQDPQPVARGVCGCGDVDACTAAAAAVMAAGRDRAYPVAEPTGGFRWVVTDGEGRPVAESAQVFTTVAACGYALHDVRDRKSTRLTS